MSIKIEKIRVKKIPKKYVDLMNKERKRKYGSKKPMDFKKEDKNGVFFFVKNNKKIMAFGMLKPVKVEYLGKQYNILGMGRGMAIKKGVGYGRILNNARIKYASEKGKSVLAFTDRKNIGFFKKVGFKISKDLIKRFRYKNPETGKIIYDPDGDGVYLEGKDKLISKMLKTKEIAYIEIPFW
ncbi:MAG: hypothetical protein AABW91_01515 [Nanoarchaeota archaeon]